MLNKGQNMTKTSKVKRNIRSCTLVMSKRNSSVLIISCHSQQFWLFYQLLMIYQVVFLKDFHLLSRWLQPIVTLLNNSKSFYQNKQVDKGKSEENILTACWRQADCPGVRCSSKHKRAFSCIDKAPRLSIRIHIWILLSDTICQLNQFHTISEAASAMLSTPA